MPDIIRWENFNPGSGVYGAEVYLKAGWFDAWGEPVKYLHAARVTWSAAPSVSTADLVWRYGQGMREDELAFSVIYRRVPQHRFFVKIVVDANVVPNHPLGDLVWAGTLEVEGDQLGGVRLGKGPAGVFEAIASGRQTITCYGFEQLLTNHIVTTARWQRGFEEFTLDQGLAFNEEGRANRSKNRGSKLAYLFAEDLDTAEHWSSRDAVGHLLAEQSPKDWAGDARIPFELSAVHAPALPAWDRPVLPTHGRTTRELLNQLMPRQRLLSYFVELYEPEGLPASVLVKPFSFAHEDILVSDGEVLPANPSQKILAFEFAPDVSAAIKRTSLDAVDQVEVVGGPRRNCGTVSVADETVDEGWTAPLEVEYEQAASTAGDYPAAEEIEDRQRRNAEARHADRLRTVFARFQLPDDFDGLVGDGLGAEDKVPLAPKDDKPDEAYPLYGPKLLVLPTLPLLERHDYSGDKIEKQTIVATGSRPYSELEPLALVPIAAEKYQYAEKMGIVAHLENSDDTTNRFWHAQVRVIPHSRCWELHVSGEPQHMIAGNRFTALDEDEAGLYDFREFLYTVAIEDPRSCLARWPEKPPLGFDALRLLRIEAGDGYRLDYVAPNTVVAIDPTTQALVRSTTGGYVRDDRPALATAARVAYQWYRQTRKALSLTAGRVTKPLWLGDLVLSIGDPGLGVIGDVHISEVRTCVTEISVDIPIAAGPVAPPRQITWQTAFGELDALAFAPRPRGTRVAGGAHVKVSSIKGKA